MSYQSYYKSLKRPPLAPPEYLFGIVWPFLYLLIIASYGYIFYQVFRGALPALIVIPFILNLIANGLFTYFQFKLKNNFLAAVDIIVVLITIILTMTQSWPHSHWVAYAQIPYLIWVSFATYLQIGVVVLNRKKS